MSKSLAIAVSLCLVAMSVSDVEAGIFGRRSGGCRGGSCYRSPSFSSPTTRVYSASRPVVRQQPVVVRGTVPAGTVKATTPASSARPISQTQNGNAVRSPSDLPITGSVPAPQSTYSSPCAGGSCYTPVYRSPCANGSCNSRTYSNRGWGRNRW